MAEEFRQHPEGEARSDEIDAAGDVERGDGEQDKGKDEQDRGEHGIPHLIGCKAKAPQVYGGAFGSFIRVREDAAW